VFDGWLLNRQWPPSVRESADRFRQGHLLRWDSIVYGADFGAAICKPTADAGDNGKGFVRIDEAFSYVILTSQTCDICEDGRKQPKMPLITVAPVYDILPLLKNKSQGPLIRKLGFSYLFPLTADVLSQENALWVADMRAQFSLEKSVFVGEHPVEAFATEPEYNDFAEWLAWRQTRPAIDNRVRDRILSPLREAFSSGKIDHQPIFRMRIQCGPSGSVVERAKLIAIIETNRADADVVESQFVRWQEELASSLGDITLFPTAVVLQSEFLHETFRNSNLVNYDRVSE